MLRAINRQQKRGFSTSFGVTIKERTFAAQNNRYGYQGSEVVEEIDSERNHITTYYREADLDIAQWWSVDPVFQPWQSPYTSMDNNPIWFNDPTGEGGELVITGENTATLVINVILYSDVVDDIKLQQLQAATQEYAKKHLGGTKELRTKAGSEVGQNEKTLSVEIQVNVQVKSFDEVVGEKGLAATNKSVANNFIYVGNTTNSDGSGDVGGSQQGNAGYVSSETRGSIVLHEALSSLEIYKSSEKGEFVDNLHGHNEEQDFSILASPFREYNKETKKYASFTGKDLNALEKKGITTPISSTPTPIGTLTNQTYKSGGGTKVEATPSPK